MAEQFLSQDEVDALLDGVNEPAEDEALMPPDGVRNYDIASQERIVRGRMPTLEIINERFARNMRVGLFNFMRRSPELSIGPVRVLKYSAFLRDLVVPTNINIAAAKPLRGNALFVCEPTLVFGIVDTLFGGSGQLHTRIEGREFTATEQRIIQRLLDVVFDAYQKAWAPVFPLSFEYTRAEMHTQFANIATPSEIVVATSFKIELSDASVGSLHICIPYSTLEPVRDLLYNTMQGDAAEPDQRWLRMLRRQVQDAEVELTAVLGTTRATVNDMLHMKVGDVLSFDVTEMIEAQVDGVPILECSYGTHNQHYALRVNKFLTADKGEDAHAAPYLEKN
ncbi:flagellar motor switch protein FliM [soil metagenome]